MDRPRQQPGLKPLPRSLAAAAACLLQEHKGGGGRAAHEFTTLRMMSEECTQVQAGLAHPVDPESGGPDCNPYSRNSSAATSVGRQAGSGGGRRPALSHSASQAGRAGGQAGAREMRNSQSVSQSRPMFRSREVRCMPGGSCQASTVSVEEPNRGDRTGTEHRVAGTGRSRVSGDHYYCTVNVGGLQLPFGSDRIGRG